MELIKEKLLHVEKISADPEKRELASALFAEIDKPKVWDNAPEWATKATINWSAPTHYSGVYKEYTRTLQKSRIDEIAEEAASHWEGGREALEKAIKSAILKDREERPTDDNR